MLKNIIFSLQENSYSIENIKMQMVRTAEYIRTCGYCSEVYVCGDEAFDKADDDYKKETLVITDEADNAEELRNRGFFCVGVLHEGNQGQEFKGLKYVFSEIEEVDMDSFVKVYQRYAGEPWEVIRTERLMIRETTVDDVDEFYRLYKEPEMTKYMEGLFENPEDEKRYQKDYIDKVYGLMGFGIWTIVRLEDNEVIGRAGYSVRNGFDEIELGFLIGKKYQHQGYAYEACSAILEYGKSVLLLEQVQALVKKDNTVSINLCKKLGFKEKDVVRVEENIYSHGYNGDGKERNVRLEKAHFGEYVRFFKSLD